MFTTDIRKSFAIFHISETINVDFNETKFFVSLDFRFFDKFATIHFHSSIKSVSRREKGSNSNLFFSDHYLG